MWVRCCTTSEVIVNNADVWPLEARSCVNVDHAASGHRVGDHLTNCGLQLDIIARAVSVAGACSAQLQSDCLKERKVISEPKCLRRRYGEREGLTRDAGVGRQRGTDPGPRGTGRQPPISGPSACGEGGGGWPAKCTCPPLQPNGHMAGHRLRPLGRRGAT